MVHVGLAIAALLTSTLSGILGMGGGMLFLAVLFSLLPPTEAIVLHAFTQIFSNGTRAIAFFPSRDTRAYGNFMIGAVPGAVLGAMAMWQLVQIEGYEPYLRIVIGIYVLVAAFLAKPRPTKQPLNPLEFRWLGLVAGIAALPFGAVGPLIAPTFARQDFVKERLIATKALCQASLHVLKIPALLMLVQMNVGRLGTIALTMIVMVIFGTLLGKRLLKFVNDEQFRVAYRMALVVTGCKLLLLDGLLDLLA